MMKKKIMSILLALVMVIGMLPTVVFAAEDDPEIYVGGVGMVSGQYLDESGNVGTTALTDNYAYYKDGVLTLHNYDYEGFGYKYFESPNEYTGNGFALIHTESTLTVNLEGDNSLIGEEVTNDDLISGMVCEESVTIKGSGALKIEVNGEGVWSAGDALTIESGSLDIDSKYDSLYAADGALYIKDGTVDIKSYYESLCATGDIIISGGTVKLESTNYICIYSMIDGDVKVEGGTVVAIASNTAEEDSFNFAIYPYSGTFAYDDTKLNIEVSENPTGTPIVAYNAADLAKYDYVKIAPKAAEPTKYDVWVIGTQVTSTNASDVLGDGAASYDAATNTLTVSKNITATGDNVSAIKATTEDDFTIDIDGSVAISSEDGNGIEVQNKAIVTGGSLTITADSYGIYADEITVDGGTYIVSGWRGLLGKSGVAISNATVTITAENNAIYSYNANCYISISNSTVTATSTDNRSIFIEADGEEAITISDSTVTVTGDNSAVYAPKVEVTGNSVVEMKATITSTPDNDYCALGGCGDNFIVADTLEVLASTEVDGSNPVPYVKADRVNYDWVKIAAPAPTLYDVWVIGTQVTSANASDVLGDGAASYDPATNTLTVKKDISSTTENAIQVETEADFTVDVEGKVKMATGNGIKYTGDGMMTVIGDELIMDVGGNAVYSDNDLKIECEKLDIDSGTFGIYSGSGDVVINNTQINISHAGWAGIVTPYGDVTVNNKVLNITGAKEAILVSEKGKNGEASLTSEEIILSTGQNSIEVIGGNCEIKCKKLKITSKWNGTHIVGDLNISADEIIVVANSDGLGTTKEYNLTIDCDVMDIQSTRTDDDATFYALSCKGTITLPEDVTVIAATEPNGTFEAYDVSKNKTYDHVKIAPKPIEYNVWVIGTRVTSDNKDDVLNDGKVSYDPDTNTLTVSRGLAATGDQNAVRAFTSGVLHIQLSGDRIISSENAGVLYTSNSVEITSDGDVTITCASDAIGPIPDLKVSTSGDVTLENTNGRICNSSLTITGVDGGAAGNVKVSADTTTLSGGKFVAQTITVNASGDVEITNAGGAVSVNALTVAGKNVKVSGDNAGALAGENATINASGNVTLTNVSGGISYNTLAIDGVDGGAAGDVKISTDTTALEGAKFVAQTVTVNASGDVEITNAGGAVSKSALTVTGADDVTVTGDTAGFLIIPSANIAASGDVTMENANGGICPSKLTIAGIDGGAAGNVKVSANTKNLDGGKFVAQTIEVKAAGDVEITNEGGSVAVTSVDVIADEVLIVGAPAGFDTAVFSYENVDGAAYVVYEGASEADLSVVKTKADGETYSSDMDVNVIKITAKKPSGGGGGGSVATYAIVVEASDNGEITASKKSASKGTDITLTVKADEGYELDTLNVLDKNGDKVKVTKKGDKYTFEMPASKVTVTATFSKIEVEPSFDDVAEDAYYFDAVEWAVEEGITSGTSATTFSPNAPCTRAQAVTFLWRAAGSPAPKSTEMPFVDVAAGAYYYDAVLWAVENGITAGTSATTFSPNNDCTRAQIVTFLWRSQKSPAGETVNPFTDVAAEAYYFDAVLWAVKNGVTAGTTANTFSPNNDCTRAQIVTFLFRALSN